MASHRACFWALITIVSLWRHEDSCEPGSGRLARLALAEGMIATPKP
jgi:hypothetical protein